MESLNYASVSLFDREELLGSFPTVSKSSSHFKNGWGEGEPLSPASDLKSSSSPLGSDWLDTRVDLLDYLAGPELEGLYQDADSDVVCIDSTSEPIFEEDPSARAVQVLRSIADEQSALLAEQARESTSNLPNCPSSLPNPIPLPHASLEEAQSDLLDIFKQAMEQSEEENITLDSSSILAEISSEDIDDILSSGPCSPAESNSGSGGLENIEPVGSGEWGTVVSHENPDCQVITVPAEVSAQLLSLIQPMKPEKPQEICVESVYSPGQSTAAQMSPAYALVPASPVYGSALSPVASPAYSYGSDYDSSDPTYSPTSERKQPTYRIKPYERARKPGSSKGVPAEILLQERKLRKKQQNRDAALRYRQKKKDEQGVIDLECDALEKRNVELHSKVDSMTKEIQYLKDLLMEIYAAKGLKLPKSAS